MKHEKFPIGFWNYPNINSTPTGDVKSWGRAGITFNQTPFFNYSSNTPEQMIAILDEMYSQGIKAFVCINDINIYNFISNPESFRPAFERAYADFGHHPATAGFFLGDEPSGDTAFNACIKMVRIMREIAPDMIPLLNFLPYWQGMEEQMLGGKSFEAWIDDFISRSECPLISYDCYAQMNPGEEGWDMYFTDLNKYTSAAKRNNVELWTTLLSCGHFRYRVPNEDDLRWQLSTAVASGCNGILWFLWYGQNNRNNYRGSPIDELGEESDTYKAIRRVQYLFHNRYGELLCNLKHISTYHYVKCYGGYPEYFEYAVPHVRKMTSSHGIPGMISRFTDSDGNEYIAIVNNSTSESSMHTMSIDPGVKHIWRYWNGNKPFDFISDPHDAFLRLDPGSTEAGFWLAPGQMEIFRLEY